MNGSLPGIELHLPLFLILDTSVSGEEVQRTTQSQPLPTCGQRDVNQPLWHPSPSSMILKRKPDTVPHCPQIFPYASLNGDSIMILLSQEKFINYHSIKFIK